MDASPSAERDSIRHVELGQTPMSDTHIFRDNNRIAFQGPFGIADVLRPLAVIHQAVHHAGYQDLILDFSDCTAAFAGPMLGLCSQVMRLRTEGVSTELVKPKDIRLSGLFRNANWSHFLDPDRNLPSVFKGFTQVPATQFTSADEQQKAVDRIVYAILGAIPNLPRRELGALEWSVNEITDNVLTHARSSIGGLVQVSTFQRIRKRVEYIVVDAGLGIPRTLRETHSDLTSDADALDHAIREGVTRDSNVGQGNGLFGSYRICSLSNGFFQIESGYGRLVFADQNLRISTEKAPFSGTLVVAQIDFSSPGLLGEALKFGGTVHRLTDYVELRYEQQSGEVVFALKNESASFGSRVAGTPVRNRLLNLLQMCPEQKIVIDFSDVPLVSSSFADEVLGKLFAGMGPLTFMQRVELRSVNATVRQLVDKAIAQRMVTGGGS